MFFFIIISKLLILGGKIPKNIKRGNNFRLKLYFVFETKRIKKQKLFINLLYKF